MSIWIPGIVVLAVGLAAGLFVAHRLRRREAAARPPSAADLELRIVDLEERRDELYARLRGDEELAASEVLALERAAACALRDLDQARAELKQIDPQAARKKPAAGEPEAAPRAAPPAVFRHPALVGFGFGAALVALVAVLIYWAGREAAPKPEAGPAAGTAAGPAPPHPEVGELPPELAARTRELESQLETDPDDLLARKELALILLDSQQFFPAFRHAEELLRRSPEDPDGLYVQGVVRYHMGRPDLAIELLDRVLAFYADHVLALGYRGLAYMRLGDVEAAIASWERGLEAAGGRQPELERFIAAARARAAGELPPEHPSVAPPTAAGAPAAGAPAAGDYRLRVELAPGVPAPSGATLFVSLLSSTESGPPAAVRRINNPTFPLDVTLGPGDSMMGEALPAAGIVLVRLDADGAIATADPGDLAVEVEARSGSTTEIILK